MWGWERGRGAASSLSSFPRLSPSFLLWFLLLPSRSSPLSSASIPFSFPLFLSSPSLLQPSPPSVFLSPPSLQFFSPHLPLPLPPSLALNANCFALLREECRHNVKSPAFLRGAFKTLPYLYYPHSLTSPTPSPVLPNFPRNLCEACGGENICTKSEGARQGRLYRALSCVCLLQSL